MRTGTALYRGDSWSMSWGTLTLDADGTLTLATGSGESSIPNAVTTSSFMDVVASESWVCAVGAKDAQIVSARAVDGQLRAIGAIERSDASGPAAIGVHAVRFHDRPGFNQSILAWELGLALIDHADGVLWQHVHGDVDRRVLAITADIVELLSPTAESTVRLANGVAEHRESSRGLDVDEATFREWRRGIGK